MSVKAMYYGTIPIVAAYYAGELVFSSVAYTPPIQTGSNLYIPCAMSATQNGTKLEVQ